MKISKLFHWLYALLMLLPFMFFIPSVLYYAFNDNATMQSVEVPKTETIAVDFNQYLDLGTYERSVNTQTYNLFDSITIQKNVNHVFVFKGSYVGDYTQLHLNVVNYSSTNFPQLNYEYTNGDFAFRFTTPYGLYVLHLFANGYGSGVITCADLQLFDLTQMFGVGNEPTLEQFNTYFPNSYYSYTQSELMQITFDTGETEQLVENTSIINYAWESIWDLPLFNWCKVSFVAVPFTYITGLFGLAASNSFNYVFTYFASMSIIWLVFDVIMYVPLLVHRWLDKGIVE